MSTNRCMEYLHDIYFIRHNMICIGVYVTMIPLQYSSHIFFSPSPVLFRVSLILRSRFSVINVNNTPVIFWEFFIPIAVFTLVVENAVVSSVTERGTVMTLRLHITHAVSHAAKLSS